jgi:hypothetical protein
LAEIAGAVAVDVGVDVCTFGALALTVKLAGRVLVVPLIVSVAAAPLCESSCKYFVAAAGANSTWSLPTHRSAPLFGIGNDGQPLEGPLA